MSLDLTERVDPGGLGPAAAFTFATQQRFCDAARDEWVFRSFGYEGPIDPRQVTIAPALGGAVARVTLPVAVTEQRFPDCAVEPTGAGGRVVDVGTLDVRLDALWRATGPAVLRGPQVWSRPAVARGRIVSALGVVALPPTQAWLVVSAGA